MSDLISRQMAIKKFEEYVGLSKVSCDAHHMILSILRSLPSAEPEEQTAKVKTVEKPNVYKCGECGQYFHSTAWGSLVEYCSRCGSKLDWSGNEVDTLFRRKT